jgi:hypothetical protein
MTPYDHDLDDERLRAEVVEDEPEELDLDDDDLEDDDGVPDEDDDYGAAGGDFSESTERGIAPDRDRVDREVDETFPASDPPANY